MTTAGVAFEKIDLNWVLRGTQAALWTCPDLSNGQCFFSEDLSNLMGCAPEDMPKTLDESLRWILPEDRKRVRRACLKVTAAAESLEEPHDPIEFRALLPHQQPQSIKWLRLSGIQSLSQGREPGPALGLRGILMDISATKAIETRALEESRHKSAFLGRMSHDMRTPLHAIIGLGDVILASQHETSQHQHVDRVMDAAESLLGLVNDLLDIEQISSGRLKLNLKPTDLRRTIWDCITLHQQTLKEGCVSITTHIDSNVPKFVMTDARRLLQVLNNLLENALKFTSEGTVCVSCQVQAKREHFFDLRFQVRDTGSGIAPDDLPHIFQPFYRGQDEEKSPRGQGLGLAIVKDILGHLGGKIRVESERGKATLFEFLLPVTECSRTGADQGLSSCGTDPREFSSSPSALSSRMRSWGHALTPGWASFADPSASPCIVVADDSPINRQIMKAYLQNEGVRVVFAENGREAVQSYGELHPDLVLMDLRMPVMTGTEATRAIRSYEKAQGLERRPILAISASALAEDVAQALAAGCDAHYAKPMRRGDLVQTLDQHLPRRPATCCVVP